MMMRINDCDDISGDNDVDDCATICGDDSDDVLLFCRTSTCVVVVPAANIGPPSSAHTLPLKTLHRDQDDEEGFRRRVFHQRWDESRSGGIFAPLEKLQLRQAADRPAYYHFITSC